MNIGKTIGRWLGVPSVQEIVDSIDNPPSRHWSKPCSKLQRFARPLSKAAIEKAQFDDPAVRTADAETLRVMEEYFKHPYKVPRKKKKSNGRRNKSTRSA